MRSESVTPASVRLANTARTSAHLPRVGGRWAGPRAQVSSSGSSHRPILAKAKGVFGPRRVFFVLRRRSPGRRGPLGASRGGRLSFCRSTRGLRGGECPVVHGSAKADAGTAPIRVLSLALGDDSPERWRSGRRTRWGGPARPLTSAPGGRTSPSRSTQSASGGGCAVIHGSALTDTWMEPFDVLPLAQGDGSPGRLRSGRCTRPGGPARPLASTPGR